MDTFTALVNLHEYQKAFPRCTSAYRRLLDAILVKHRFPGIEVNQMNFREMPEALRQRLDRTQAVNALIDTGAPAKVIGKQVTLEHVISMKTLMAYLKQKRFEDLVSEYRIALVTRDEDRRLSEAKRGGAIDAGRYSSATPPVILLSPSGI